MANDFVASLKMNVGQLFANPVLVVAEKGPALDAIIITAGEALKKANPFNFRRLFDGQCEAEPVS